MPNSSELTESMLNKLRRSTPDLLKNIDRYPRLVIELSGHTGPGDKNEALAQTRADVLRLFLEARGVPSNRMKLSAHGPAQPRFVTGDSGRNRRVDILTYPQ